MTNTINKTKRTETELINLTLRLINVRLGFGKFFSGRKENMGRKITIPEVCRLIYQRHYVARGTEIEWSELNSANCHNFDKFILFDEFRTYLIDGQIVSDSRTAKSKWDIFVASRIIIPQSTRRISGVVDAYEMKMNVPEWLHSRNKYNTHTAHTHIKELIEEAKQ